MDDHSTFWRKMQNFTVYGMGASSLPTLIATTQ